MQREAEEPCYQESKQLLVSLNSSSLPTPRYETVLAMPGGGGGGARLL